MKFKRLSKSKRKGSGAGFRDKPPSKFGRGFLFLFGLPFFAMGFFLCWIAAINPICKSISSADWPQVPCEIIVSHVNSHSSSDGTTYTIEIKFNYSYQTIDYNGGSYSFDTIQSSGRKRKQKIIAKYPIGSEAVCWVNPDAPEEAVLSRRVPGIVYFIIPFTSIFMLVGLGIMLGALGILPKKRAKATGSKVKEIDIIKKGETELKPSASGWVKVLVVLGIALFWNGIVSVFLYEVIQSYRNDNPDIFLTVFLIPFVLIGLALTCGVFYQLLALANPKFRLTLSEASPRLGQKVNLQWKSSGSLKRLDKLTIKLEGRECATYRRGTDSVTDHATFHLESLFETDLPSENASGSIHIQIPPSLMHTFHGDNNKIEWRLLIEGPIRRWPDVDEDYPLTVRPAKIK